MNGFKLEKDEAIDRTTRALVSLKYITKNEIEKGENIFREIRQLVDYIEAEVVSMQSGGKLSPCGHLKSKMVQVRFGSSPYCEDCHRAEMRGDTQ